MLCKEMCSSSVWDVVLMLTHTLEYIGNCVKRGMEIKGTCTANTIYICIFTIVFVGSDPDLLAVYAL